MKRTKRAKTTSAESGAATNCGKKKQQREATDCRPAFARNRATVAVFGSAPISEKAAGTGTGTGNRTEWLRAILGELNLGITAIGIEWLRERDLENGLETIGIPLEWLPERDLENGLETAEIVTESLPGI